MLAVRSKLVTTSLPLCKQTTYVWVDRGNSWWRSPAVSSQFRSYLTQAGRLANEQRRPYAQVAIPRGAQASYEDTREFHGIRTSFNESSDSLELFIQPKALKGTEQWSPISRVWLRDHCQCSECVHPETKQRQFDVLKSDSHAIHELNIDDNGIRITWADGKHSSAYSKQFLDQALGTTILQQKRDAFVTPRSWAPNEGASVQNEPPEVDYEHVMNTNDGLAEWTRKIHEVGFCFVDGCPPSPEATEALLQRLGPIRNTHYGAFWDFTSNLSSKDTAYTSLGLDVHTDTTYFSEPAGLQLFHLLSHEGNGGENQLVDGFAAAQLLAARHPEHFRTLKEYKLHAHASGNEGITIQPQAAYSVISTRQYGDQEQLYQIRWNNYDRATLPIATFEQSDSIDRWYEAARAFDRILHEDSPSLFYQVQLKPGRPIIFNNWRVLHGRSVFDGRRRMCGGYINMDDFISCYKTTNFGWKSLIQSGVI